MTASVIQISVMFQWASFLKKKPKTRESIKPAFEPEIKPPPVQTKLTNESKKKNIFDEDDDDDNFFMKKSSKPAPIPNRESIKVLNPPKKNLFDND